MSIKYKEAGVDLQAGYDSVELIKKHVAKTKVKGAIDSIGAFGGMFDLSSLNIKEPVLVSGTDGVGTKLLLAIESGINDTIGIDAVAMCTNDVIVAGAAPLYFLDYLAVAKNKPEVVEEIVRGVSEGCILSECALIGGETAEMPDMYEENHYDIAGFCVGVVEKSKLLNKNNIKENQILIGLPSSGCHSNGFSLIRKILIKDHNLDLNKHYDEFNKTLIKELLTPTKIYVKAVKHLLNNNVDIKGMSHITGGGFYENLPRMYNDDLGVEINLDSFKVLPIFKLLQEKGDISDDEMYHIFNMGIGFVLAVDKSDETKVLELLKEINEEASVIGKVTNSGKVVLK